MAEALSLTLGQNADESGTVEVLPEHGDLTVGDAIFVGKGGKGNLTQTFGTIMSATASIASQTGSSGSATVDGTTTAWRVSGEADVGGTATAAGGTGLLTVTNSGTVSAASVHVWNSGTLTGTGTVSVNSGSGTVTADGTLAPTGTLTITGNLSFGANANMSCNVSSTRVDKAQVSGIATLNGKLSVTMSVTGDFTLLHAGNGRNGTEFSSYSFIYIGCLSASVSYQDNSDGSSDVILHVVSTCN
jgi:T5SS/PEP-CTERM-associated repeat protein